jgi:hypothetical protein
MAGLMYTRRTLLLGIPYAAVAKPLFNGRSPEGWRDAAGGPFPSASWTVEDGCLKSVVHEPDFQDLRTTEEFDDFTFEFEWKIAPGGNSGVKYLVDRVNRFPVRSGSGEHVRARGLEFQLIDNERNPDARKDPRHHCGALYGILAPSESAAHPAGEWNTARLAVRRPEVEHWINERRVVRYRLDNPAILERAAQRKWKPVAGPSPIALQNHSSETWFRNLNVR